jgi:hypothetical protein
LVDLIGLFACQNFKQVSEIFVLFETDLPQGFNVQESLNLGFKDFKEFLFGVVGNFFCFFRNALFSLDEV